GLLEGIVVDAAGAHAYVQGRSTHNVAVLDIMPGATPPVAVGRQGPNPIECLAGADPMSAQGPKTVAGSIRKGMRLFYTANISAFPITQNFWVACASCHLEGQTDAVVWLFKEGPRDTPSNAGGPINTGF